MTKVCTKCGETLSKKMFTSDTSKKDKLYPSCKKCQRRHRIITGKTKLPEKLSKGQKRCTKCKKVFSVDNFRKDKSKKDGLYSSCNDCSRVLMGVKNKRQNGWGINNGYKVYNTKRQHRVIMERILGRKLKNNEVVHHKNGVKTDNRPENLEVMTRAEHTKLHKKNGQTKEVYV